MAGESSSKTLGQCTQNKVSRLALASSLRTDTTLASCLTHLAKFG